MAKPTDFIASQSLDGVKEHSDYDGSNRLEFVYTAPLYAGNGDVCLVTRYQYVGATGRISGRKEYVGAWNSAWDF